MENLTLSDCSETWLENGIVIQKLKPEIIEIDLPIAKQLIQDRYQASGGKIKRPVLVIPGDTVYVGKDARKYYKTDEPYEYLSAIAIVVDNYLASIIGNIVFSLSKKRLPIEIFYKDKEKAKTWLLKHQ